LGLGAAEHGNEIEIKRVRNIDNFIRCVIAAAPDDSFDMGKKLGAVRLVTGMSENAA
jgi:hypothetical protein